MGAPPQRASGRPGCRSGSVVPRPRHRLPGRFDDLTYGDGPAVGGWSAREVLRPPRAAVAAPPAIASSPPVFPQRQMTEVSSAAAGCPYASIAEPTCQCSPLVQRDWAGFGVSPPGVVPRLHFHRTSWEPLDEGADDHEVRVQTGCSLLTLASMCLAVPASVHGQKGRQASEASGVQTHPDRAGQCNTPASTNFGQSQVSPRCRS
jgi:hypothetical protein